MINYQGRFKQASVYVKLDDAGGVNVKTYGAKGDGTTDDTVVIQAAIDYGLSSNQRVYFPTGTYKVTSRLMRNSGTTIDGTESICLSLSSGADLFFEPGAKLLLANAAISDTKVLVMNTAQNVRILGQLEIDGKMSAVSGGNNQMHGIYVYKSQNIYVESVYVHDCYGDNINIDGTEAIPSANIKIDYLRCFGAGRKNLYYGYVDKLHIDTAILDNTTGNAGVWTGGDTLHVQPASFGGTKDFYQSFGYLHVNGKGTEFNVGATEAIIKRWIVSIGSCDIRTISTDPAIQSFGVTLDISDLAIKSTDGLCSVGINTSNAQRISIKSAVIDSVNGKAVYGAMLSSNKPKIQIGSLRIDAGTATNSSGVQIEGGDLSIDYMDCVGLKNECLYVLGNQNDTLASVRTMVVRNCGVTQIVFITSTSTFKPMVALGSIAVFDSRTTKVTRIVEFETANAVLGTNIGSLYNPYSITEWATTTGGITKYVKIAGGAVLPAVYMVEGTPEGIITAPKGSVALRTDGGASTSFYSKESGTGNTGWTAMGSGGSGSGVVNASSLPTASVTYRGMIYNITGGTGVADLAYICKKDETETYHWVEISFNVLN